MVLRSLKQVCEYVANIVTQVPVGDCLYWMACRRCDKIDAASKRIANAKKDLLLEINSELSPPVSCNSSSSQEKKRKLNHPMSSPDETKSALDWEDLIIEYLLLRGVSQCFCTDCVLPLLSIKCWPFDHLGILLTST